MLLTFLAFAVAFVAILRASALASEVRKLTEERDALRALVALRPEAMVEGTGPSARLPVEPVLRPPLEDESEKAIDTGVRLDLEAASDPESGPAPNAEPTATTDWESVIGVRGALWMGGVAFLVSGLFFARWTIEQELLSPQSGFGLLLLAGGATLALAELSWRRGFEKASSPLSGAGVAILAIACIAAHARYELVSAPLALLSMTVVIATGGLLSVRYKAFATAVLSLLAGLSIPLLVMAGAEWSAIAFGLVFGVDIGAFALASKRQWFVLPWLGLWGTLFLAMRWSLDFLSPVTLPLGLGLWLAVGLFYLVVPRGLPEEGRGRFRRISSVGSLAVFPFAVIVATFPKYIAQWPFLFMTIATLDVALLVDAVREKRGARLRGAAFATAFLLGWWALQGLRVDSPASFSGSTLFAIFIVAIFGVSRRVASGLGGASSDALRVFETAALAAGSGLVLFGTVMIAYGRGSPVGPFLAIATTLALILREVSSHSGRLKGTLVLGTLGLAGLTQIWFLSAVKVDTLVWYLAGPAVVSLLLSLLAGRAYGRGVDLEAEISVQASAWIAMGGLFLALRPSESTTTGWPLFVPLASAGVPLFVGLAIQTVVVAASVFRTGWLAELPALLGACALYIHLWQRSYLGTEPQAMAFGTVALFYLGFLALPILMAFRDLRRAWALLVASALSGPLFFFSLRAISLNVSEDAAPGLLALVMAGLSAATLAETSRLWATRARDLVSESLQPLMFGLYAGVALWFIALAIGLQFDRQWATLAWVLEAVGVSWLATRTKHPALPAFAGALYALVAVRLLMNPAVLTYEERALPILNWILFTYGLGAVAFWLGQRLLRRVSGLRFVPLLSDAIGFFGLLLVFWMINLEILDYFSKGPYITLSGQSGYAMNLAFSVAWGAYAVGLLAAGVARQMRLLRYLSLAFMILTVAKVFLYDLAALGGFFRVFSFFGLAGGLIAVSFFYQRFVFRRSH